MNNKKIEYDKYSTWKGWNNKNFFSYDAERGLYFAAELSSFKNLKINCLEIGFGSGDFASWAIKSGFNWRGVEVQKELISLANNHRLSVYSSITEAERSIGHSNLDLCIGFDVFEHMDLNDFIRHLEVIFDLLCPGGILLGRVPSGDSPFGRAIFHGDITHKLALGSSAIRQLADRVGFEVIEIRPPRLPIFGLGIMRAIRRFCIHAVHIISSKLINSFFHNGSQCIITSNLVFVLKKPS